MGKSKRDDLDEENTEKEVKRIRKKKKVSLDEEAEEAIFKSTKDEKKKKKKKRQIEDFGAEETYLNSTEDAKKNRQSEDSGSEETNLNSAKDAKKKRKKKKMQSEDSGLEETNMNSTKDASKKMQSKDSGDEETNLNSAKDAKKKRKKKRQSEDSGAEETNLNSIKDAKKKRQSKDSGDEETNLNSAKDAKKKRKKKRQSEDSWAEETNLNSSKDAKKKRKKKKRQSEDSEAAETNFSSTKDAKKKRKTKRQSEDSEAEETSLNSTKDAKKKRKKKRQSEDSEAEETSLNSTKDSPMEREKKLECGKNDKDVTTPSSKTTKKVVFSDKVEVFPADDEESNEEEGKLVIGKRFTKEEDKLIKNAVLEYVDNHALGDEGVKMVMECKLHPQLKGCWKDIASALPWRTYVSVYHRAHVIFEAGSKGAWTKEDMELVLEYQKKHGNDWRTLADAMGKNRKHVKDAWRRYRLRAKKNGGHWMREEYQTLFDLVNKDIRTKAFQEKHLKHGMLRDNIPWMAVSDKLESRDHTECCIKWYDQLISPLVAKGIWANVDDYRLLEELWKLDAACIDDVDWDNLLDNRDGETCRKRWNQMVKHIGSPGSKTFAEQVEILSNRYCPDLAEDREDFDNRPYDPED